MVSKQSDMRGFDALELRFLVKGKVKCAIDFVQVAG